MTDQTIQSDDQAASTDGALPAEPTNESVGPAEEAPSTEQPMQPAAMPAALQKINHDLKEKAVMEQAAKLGFSYIDIEKTPLNTDLAAILPKDKALSALVMPFFRVGKKLRVAIFDHEKEETKQILDELKSQDFLLNINLASDDGIKEAISRLYAETDKQESPEIVTQIREEEIEAYEKEIENLGQLTEKLKSITSEEALNLINVGAIKTGASDVHFQPEEANVSVRFRIDGVLQTIFQMDPKIFANLANQLKYKAGMKLNINNVPQDGRYYFKINDRKIDVRVSALPTEYGEAFVCRLLDSGKGFLEFDQCGFIGRNLELMNLAIKISHGMILVTGPTGSGKTTTLYSMLNQFNQPDSKVITLEDPIEYHLPGISQSQINVKREYTFASGLRAILRQDPDVVMVGEIRDFETAETAAQAALTGHVLLSTLHTNSAVETIPRLINIGLEPFMVAPSLHMIIAQRLVRKLCENCRKEVAISEVEKKELEKVCATATKLNPGTTGRVPAKLWHPGECDKCSHTGYSGQMGIHEILVVNDEIRQMILEGAPNNEIMVKAREQGMLTMREDGLLKVMQELTTLEEVQRVTQVL
ncbi:type II/IV secretion system protein [Candidatus Peregrinibacteria bacterium]|jgi:type IV pilus assembly protein PilB|nr:type II/IV secretion system protein [Candidatus Peregrinibacteria bacterium]MBT7484053.1 type II/IV secretion system protein [Candidatus Peregrinibacteria bacterium]MBT7702730.1 type II/IV secretion system protein [Candidatus Peregrinibacteria bacterium]